MSYQSFNSNTLHYIATHLENFYPNWGTLLLLLTIDIKGLELETAKFVIANMNSGRTITPYCL